MNRPLDRSNITWASGIMLPAYVVLFLAFGAAYVTDPDGRLSRAPSVTFQRDFMPLWCWGAAMIMTAILILVAFRTGNRAACAYALCCAAVTWFLWGCSVAAAIPLTPNTTYLAPVLPWFVSVCCIASTKSLIRQESRPR